ncbi:hypothetical protein EDB19DRAFT_1835562 [Suillus lakei]|nr:hypothetical protein EDB19DRAFT_1835562 [Suillus lakei]
MTPPPRNGCLVCKDGCVEFINAIDTPSMVRSRGSSSPTAFITSGKRWMPSNGLPKVSLGSFCGQAYLAHVRFSPHASSFQGPQPTTTTSTPRGSLMVASSQPPATMWQGPSDNFSAMQSTNDRRVSHAALHRGQRSVTSGPFGHSLAVTRRPRASTSRRSVSSSGPLPGPDPLSSTFRLNLIPYSVTGTSSDEADPFLGQLKLYTAKILPLQRRLQEYNLSFLGLIRSSTADKPVWQQVTSFCKLVTKKAEVGKWVSVTFRVASSLLND